MESTQKSQKKAFTLTELLVTLGCIAILIAILIPSLSSSQKAALRTKTKSQLHQYALALEQYRIEYGHYPNFLTPKDQQPINLAQCNPAFIKTLSARTPEHMRLTQTDRLHFNPKAIAFYQFNENDFTDDTLTDAFHNPNIYVLIDTQNTGTLNSPLLPTDKPLRAHLSLFTKKEDAPDAQDVLVYL